MAVCNFTVAEFTQRSSWTGNLYLLPNENGEYESWYSTPTTPETNKTFDLSELPAGAVLESAVLSSVFENPWTGAAIKSIDDATYSSGAQKNVLSKLQALNGNYAYGVTFKYKFKANGRAGSCSFSGDPHSSPLDWTANTLSVTYHMPASTFTTSPNDNANVDTNVTVTITPADPSFTHKVIWWTGPNISSVNLSAGTNSTNIQVPASWLPTLTTSTVEIIVETYSAGVKTGQTSKIMTFNVPNYAPYLPTISLPSPTHIRGILPADWDYAKGKSKAKLDPTCYPGSGAMHASLVISNGASGTFSWVTGGLFTYTTDYLNTTGAVTFRATVTDTRGRSAYADQTITVYDYFLPSCTLSTAYRSTAAGAASNTGTYITVNPVFVFASVNNKNSSAGYVLYRLMPSGDWTYASQVYHNTPAVIGGGAIDITKSYQVWFILRDELYPNLAESDYYVDIGTSKVLFNAIGDTKACFFGYAEKEGLNINGPFLIDGNRVGIPSNRNLLINGTKFPVWQRGTSFTNPSSAITADMWKASAASVIQIANGARVGFTSAWQSFSQERDGYSFASGEVVTVSAKLLSSVARPLDLAIYTGETYIGDLAINATTSYTVYSKTVTLGSDISILRVFLQNTTTLTSNVDIQYIKLEEGPIATPETQPIYPAESMACNRYFYRVTGMWNGTAWSAGNVWVSIPLPVKMRIAPILASSADVVYYSPGTGYVAPASVSLASTTSADTGVIQIAANPSYPFTANSSVLVSGTFSFEA